MVKDINEEILELLNEGIRDYMKKVKAGMAKFDEDKLRVMETTRKNLSRQGSYRNLSEMYEGEDENRAANVKENIRYRAELREKKAMKFPNIANLLTGGAPGIVGQMGKMQGQASKPFKAVYDYKKAQEASKGFEEEIKEKYEDDPFYEMSKAEKKRGRRLEGEEEGTKKRAGGGFGKNLMGKRMQGMIGKVGKFMESSKGQGMMAGGMMGASILTMIIKKAMEASPMLQQMLKIMNVAMTLFLRPIGDFIGGMLKPIMLFFLREVAVPMLRAGKGMIKYGEVFGKQVLGFLLKPVETITNAIQAAVHWDEGVRLVSSKFDGIKEWMTEQKLGVFAAQMDMGGQRSTIQNLLNLERQHLTAKEGSLFPSTVQPSDIEADAIAQLGVLRAQFPAVMKDFTAFYTDLRTNVYEQVGKLDSGVGLGVGGGMGAIAEKFSTSVSEASGKVVTALELLAETLDPTKKQEPPIVDEDTTGTTPTTGGTVYDQPQLPHWSDISVYDTVGKMYQAASQQIMQTMNKNKKGSPEYEKAFEEYTVLTGGPGGPGSKTVLEGIQKRFKIMTEALEREAANMKLIPPTLSKEFEMRNDMNMVVEAMTVSTSLEMYQHEQREKYSKDASENVKNSSTKIVSAYVSIATAASAAYKKVLSILSSMSTARSYGSGIPGAYGSGGSGGGGNTQSLTIGGITYNVPKNVPTPTPKKLDFSGRRFLQHGGMINEPIWGVGASGTQYNFGEAGPEMVTPMNKGGGGIGPVTINVNVDSINSDVDLEKIKPVIERALQEVHSRRGII